MIENGKFSAAPLRAGFVHPVARRIHPLTAYAFGHERLRDPSGPPTFLWFGEFRDGAVWCKRDGTDDEPTHLFDRPGITMISMAFDLAMMPVVSFEDEQGSWIWWYDSIAEAYSTTKVDGRSPFVAMDDRRVEQTALADVILTYLRGDKVYQRIQRDRYTIEYTEQPPGVVLTDKCRITAFAMNTGNRMQWRIRP
ncbi:tail fiber [Stenotrophomonas phage Ponderosa]|uniref:Tail fiber n=1 Tax=Stenotrophomonas phage Ponderosa TaxID=2591103 RepID=A0A5B9N6Z6_9CAUD|nr:tail fiber [Stenotrophomonas phage Ponderosa]